MRRCQGTICNTIEGGAGKAKLDQSHSTRMLRVTVLPLVCLVFLRFKYSKLSRKKLFKGRLLVLDHSLIIHQVGSFEVYGQTQGVYVSQTLNSILFNDSFFHCEERGRVEEPSKTKGNCSHGLERRNCATTFFANDERAPTGNKMAAVGGRSCKRGLSQLDHSDSESN